MRLARNFTTQYAQAGTVADRKALWGAVANYAKAVALQETNDDVRVILDPYEVGKEAPRPEGMVLGEPISKYLSSRTWVHDDLISQAEYQRILANAAGHIHIRIVDTNYQLPQGITAPGFRADLSKDFTNDREQPRLRDHSTLCWGNLFGPEGLLREAAEQGLVSFSLVKALRYAGYGFGSEIDAALAYCRDNPTGASLDIISMSFGGNSAGDRYTELFKPATDAGSPIVFVAAAGNSGGTGNPSTVGSPAKVPECIAVASYDRNRNRSGFSSAGPELDMTAPGSSTPSRDLEGNRITWSGTSSSCPNLCGVLALLALENDAIRDHHTAAAFLTAFAFDLGEEGDDVLYGHGAAPVGNYLDEEPPGSDPDPGDDDQPDPPAPDPEENIINRPFTGPFVVRFRTLSEHRGGGRPGVPGGWQLMIIDDITAQCLAQDKKEEIPLLAETAVRDYYRGHSIAMVIPDDQGAADVAEYLPRFLYYWTRDKDGPTIRTYHMACTDSKGGVYCVYPDEERYGAPVTEEADFEAVQLLVD
jgi:hypothetical protein